MSYAHDEALDRMHDPPPTSEERALVQAFKWNHIGLAELYRKLGVRAIPVCAHLGIMSVAAVTREISPGELAGIPTARLEAELARRRAEEPAGTTEADPADLDRRNREAAEAEVNAIAPEPDGSW